jgi:hypothetical protein
VKRSKCRHRKPKSERRRSEKQHPERHDVRPDSLPHHQPCSPETSNLLPYDEALLERSLTQWQFGDWDSLARISLEALRCHPDRAKLALLAAAAHFHDNNAPAVRQFVTSAREWGCSKKLVGQFLVAGVHNTLGRAATARGQEGRAMEHFETSIAIGTPTSDARLLAKARLRHQLEQFDLHATSRPPQFLPRPPADATPAQMTSAASYATHPSITVRQLSFHDLGNARVPTPGNTSASHNHSMLTSGQWQYAAFCVDERTLRIVQRDLSSGALITFDLSGLYAMDQAHGYIALAIDRAGYLHLTYREQHSPLAYRRSITPNSITGWTKHLDLFDPKKAAVTFPSFILPATAKPGRPLMLLHADGHSDECSACIDVYDEATRCWVERLTPILSGTIKNHRPMHVYWSDPVTGIDGSLHLAFVFCRPVPVDPDTLDEVNLGYAKSMDDGLTWHTSTDCPYELPVTPLNAEIVHAISRDHLPITGPRITLDSRNRPHITLCTDCPDGCGQHHHIWFDGLGWRHQFTPPLRIDTPRKHLSRIHHPPSPPAILIDSQDTVYVIYDDALIDGTQNVLALIAPDYIFDPALVKATCDANLPFSIGSIDHTRWGRDAILSMLVQHVARLNDSRQACPIATPLLLVEVQLNATPRKPDLSRFQQTPTAPHSMPM